MDALDYILSDEADAQTIDVLAAFQLFLQRGFVPPITPQQMVQLTPDERALVAPWARDCDRLCDYAEAS